MAMKIDWAHLQVIDSPLREHAHRTAAAVVSMWDAYCSFQIKEVGQDALELSCEKMKASAIGTASKASPAPLPSPSTIRKRSSSLALLYAVRKARPQSPSQSVRDFPTAELRSLKATRADCCKVSPTSPLPPVVVRREPPPVDEFEFTHVASFQ